MRHNWIPFFENNEHTFFQFFRYAISPIYKTYQKIGERMLGIDRDRPISCHHDMRYYDYEIFTSMVDADVVAAKRGRGGGAALPHYDKTLQPLKTLKTLKTLKH